MDQQIGRVPLDSGGRLNREQGIDRLQFEEVIAAADGAEPSCRKAVFR